MSGALQYGNGGKAISENQGGYDDGYASSPCFWGRKPGSLIKDYLRDNGALSSRRVLDLGCGEGKNAFAFAQAGALVDAVDCSTKAIANGRSAFAHTNISWIHSNAVEHLIGSNSYDLIIMYGLLHCLATREEISLVTKLAIEKTTRGGIHFVVSFNNGPQDLSAHPNFRPTLISHEAYVTLYDKQKIISANSSVIHETHPNNEIPHFHSITRLVASITHELP